MNAYFVYGLIDPLYPNRVRYVGYTEDMNRRFIGHLKDKTSTYKARWLRKVLREGRTPRMIILDFSTDRNEALQKEMSYIAEYRKIEGKHLTNETEGGAGGKIVGNARRKFLKRMSDPLHRAHMKEVAAEVSSRPSVREARRRNALAIHADPNSKINGKEAHRKQKDAKNRNWADPVYVGKCSRATKRRWQDSKFRSKMLKVLKRARKTRWDKYKYGVGL